MNLMNNGFVLSNFTGWDIDTSADEQARQIMKQNLSLYFYITKNTYTTVFENLERIAANIKKQLETELDQEASRQLLLMNMRLLFYAVVLVIMVVILVRIYVQTGDTFEYYGYLEEHWICHKLDQAEEFIDHLRSPKTGKDPQNSGNLEESSFELPQAKGTS